jgi:signal transduction histidine kinase
MELMVPFAEDGQLLRMLSTVRRNGEHLKHLVEEMLKESAHIDTDTVIKVERRCFDLWPVVQDVMHDLEPVAETAATRLVNSIRADLQVYADASLLKRALQNLVANAITYAPHGTVEVGDGAGIPDGQHGKIFEKGATDHKRDGRSVSALPSSRPSSKRMAARSPWKARPGAVPRSVARSQE